jgi:hypothetical protein
LVTVPATVDAALREKQAPLRLPLGLQRMDVPAARTAADRGALEPALGLGGRQLGNGSLRERSVDGGREAGEELLDNLIIIGRRLFIL